MLIKIDCEENRVYYRQVINRSSMKILFSTAFLALLASATFTGAAQAQILIAWSASTPLTDDSDIKTNGIFFDAVNSTQQGGTYTTTTIGDSTFNALTNVVGGTPGQDGTDGTITIHSDGGNYSGFNFTGGSASYKAILNTSSDANNGSVTIGSLAHPLISGDTYQVELFAYYPGPYAAMVNGNPSVSFPNYGSGCSIGTFVANATTETFTYGGIADNSGHAGFLDDVAVRDLGEVPEPATWAMMFAGLGVLALGQRLRGKLTI